MTAIADEKYVRLTTFTRDGRPKHTPVWIADLGDGRAGFTTDYNSWKAKRIRHTSAIELAPSSARGVVADGIAATTATAMVVTGAEYDPVEAAIKAKYGFQATLASLSHKVGRLFGRGTPQRGGIVITFV